MPEIRDFEEPIPGSDRIQPRKLGQTGDGNARDAASLPGSDLEWSVYGLPRTVATPPSQSPARRSIHLALHGLHRSDAVSDLPPTFGEPVTLHEYIERTLDAPPPASEPIKGREWRLKAEAIRQTWLYLENEIAILKDEITGLTDEVKSLRSNLTDAHGEYMELLERTES